MKRWFAGGIAAAALISSLATQAQTKNSQGVERANSRGLAEDPDVIAAQRTPRAVMSMMKVTLDDRVGRGNEATRAVGGYTRLELRYVPEAGEPDDPRIYDEQKRSTVFRWFAGKSIARIFSIKATLARPQVTTTAVMASVAYDSSKRAGESWTSEFNSQRVLTPYFRIDADTAVNVESTLTANATYDSSVVSDLVGVVRRASSLVAPNAALVTSLNKERFDDAAKFVDQSLANLLKESIVERSNNDFPVSMWSGHDLADIQIWLPIGNEITPGRKTRADQQLKPVGRWIVSAAPAILSIFSATPLIETQRLGVVRDTAGKLKNPADACAGDRDLARACAAFATLDPQTVMNFEVDKGVSIAQSMAGDTGIAAAREALIKASTADTAAPAARTLCVLAANKAQALGFNRVDVAAILWAYASQAFVTNVSAIALQDDGNCAPLKIAYGLGLPKGGFAAPNEQVPPAA